MKNYIIVLLTLATIYCNAQNTVAENKLAIFNTEKEFCNYALEHGFNKAFLKYAADDIVKLNNGQLPAVGKATIAAKYGNDAGTKSISWYPVDGSVAESGELGYTWGNWKFTTPDTVYYGNYTTVWKKQKDGSWKMLLDGGNDTPIPAENK
ncbi:MAG: DUF4440 domain-containing protein [Fimbriimonadaceae bacterium]|nr:DUF4440 domain-containing protein [Chitinophagales bacterium]